VRRDPRQFGEKRTRWTLAAIKRSCGWLRVRSLSGVWRVLRRLKIHYKRARYYIHSPDPAYTEKLQDVHICLRRCIFSGAVLLFQDEFTYYRQPTLAAAYELVGHVQPLALLSYCCNSTYRVAATLNAFTGQVIYCQSPVLGVNKLVSFYQQVCEAYPGVEVIYIVQDNWPVHFHPDVLAALQPQEFKWPIHVPPNWPTQPSPSARRLNLPIQLLPLPTYASWTNPADKLWRWLKQDVLHLHRYADRWAELHKEVGAFLDQFSQGSPDLLRYVGLTPQSKLYGAALIAATGPPWLRN
jgi:hypothetical protein